MSLQMKQCLFAASLTSSANTSPLQGSRKAGKGTAQRHRFALRKLVFCSLPPHRHLCACTFDSPVPAPAHFPAWELLNPIPHRPAERQPARNRSNLLLVRGKSPGPLEEQSEKHLNKTQTLVWVGFPGAQLLPSAPFPPEAVPGTRGA